MFVHLEKSANKVISPVEVGGAIDVVSNDTNDATTSSAPSAVNDVEPADDEVKHRGFRKLTASVHPITVNTTQFVVYDNNNNNNNNNNGGAIDVDGSTLVPWSRGKPMAWDVTVPDMNAESHIGDTATEAGAAANQAAANKSPNMMNCPARTSSTQLP